MTNTARSIWFTWERQRRNRSMAAMVGAELHELTYSGNRLVRYLVLCKRTIAVIRRRKPEVVYFQNPSIVLGALIAFLKTTGLYRGRTVGDFHNSGVFPRKGTALSRWIARHSDLTLVSNARLVAVVESWGAAALAVPDPLPAIHVPDSAGATPSIFTFLFVCSWAEDEPIANVVGAAQLAAASHPQFKIMITGRPKLDKYLPGLALPPNVMLTGFLSEHDFDAALAVANVVIDLTTRDDCMVCGAYEAVAAGRPAILSNNQPTVDYFSAGALFTDNSAQDICARMVEGYNNYQTLLAGVRSLKQQIQQREAVLQKRILGPAPAASIGR